MYIDPATGKVPCILCSSYDLHLAYTPPSSKQGRMIFVCMDCSLVQSLPRYTSDYLKQPNATHGASFGNIRYGKKLRLDFAAEVLDSVLVSSSTRTVLDVGSSRGDFIAYVHFKRPDIAISAIEPDKGIMGSLYPKNAEIINNRIEEVTLVDNHYDIIHCCHTLEHLHNPVAVLVKLRNALAPKGYLYLEVPNILDINHSRDLIIEEIFIDKHLYHFTRTTLEMLVQSLGFSCVNAWVSPQTLTMLLVKGQHPTLYPIGHPLITPVSDYTHLEAKQILASVHGYAQALQENKRELQKSTQRLNELMAKQPVSLWGTGRILSAFVEAGLNTKLIHYLIDSYIPLDAHKNYNIRRPEKNLLTRHDTVVIMSREYQAEIKEQCLNLYGCKAIGWNEI